MRLRIGILLLTLLNACGSASALLGDGELAGPDQGGSPDQGGAPARDSATAATPIGGEPSGGTAVVSASSSSTRVTTGATSAAGGVTAAPTSGTGGGADVSAGGAVSAGTDVSTSFSAEDLDRATARCGSSSWIFSGLVRNSRDLGGAPIGSGFVACHRLYRGSQLNAIGSAGCAEFAALGIRTVIDLRTEAEVNAAPSVACVQEADKRVAAPMPTPYGLSAENYITDLKQPASLRAVFEVLADPAAYPVYFHCIYGRDRTGVLAALLLRLLGVSREVVMAEYMRSGESGVGAVSASLEATLDELERLGGAEAYLLSIGITAESIAVFRSQTTDL